MSANSSKSDSPLNNKADTFEHLLDLFDQTQSAMQG